MLIQFAVTNYRSFHETTVLSMVPAPGVHHEPGQVIQTGLAHIPQVLRVAVVYGPNGAGKSNLVRALITLQALVLQGRAPKSDADSIPFMQPFRLADGDAASTFEVEIVVSGRHFSYGLVASRMVVEEWLYEKFVGSERAIFHRTATEDWPATLLMDASLLPAARALAQNLPPERLYLSACGESGLGDCAMLWKWFSIVEPDHRYHSMSAYRLLRFPQALAHVERLLGDAGVGDVEIQFIVHPTVDDATRSRLAEGGIQVGTAYSADVFPGWAREELIPVEVALLRRTPSGRPVVFGLDDESDGTRRLIELGRWHFGVSWSALGIVDEIERSLHPLVVWQLVAGVVAARGDGQLVCTTHDSNLLDRTMLPADSIWFAQKGPDGATKLYSLAEFDPDQLKLLGDDLERGYLNGRFGAIPFVGDTRRLGWAK